MMSRPRVAHAPGITPTSSPSACVPHPKPSPKRSWNPGSLRPIPTMSGIGSRSSGSGSSRSSNPWLSERLSAYFLVFDSKTCYAFDHPARFTVVEEARCTGHGVELLDLPDIAQCYDQSNRSFVLTQRELSHHRAANSTHEPA